MSRVAPRTPEPVVVPRRMALSGFRKQELLTAQAEKCAACGEPFDALTFDTGQRMVGPFEADHRIPLELGGSNEFENWQLLCIPCHRLKTKADRKAIAKAHRLVKRADGTRRARKPIPRRARPWPQRANSR